MGSVHEPPSLLQKEYTATLDMQTSLDYRVFEVDGAHLFVIHEHFGQWVANAPQEEQGNGKIAARSRWYDCCLHVGKDDFQSVFMSQLLLRTS